MNRRSFFASIAGLFAAKSATATTPQKTTTADLLRNPETTAALKRRLQFGADRRLDAPVEAAGMQAMENAEMVYRANAARRQAALKLVTEYAAGKPVSLN